MATTQDGAHIAFSFDEIEFLRLLCVLPEAGALLDRIAAEPGYRQVLRERLRPQAESAIALVYQWERLLDRDGAVDDQSASIEGPGRLLHLFTALRLLQSMLSIDPRAEDIDLHIWRPRPGRKRMHLAFDGPTLVLQPGSLIAEIIRSGAIKLPIWAVTAGLKQLLPRAIDHVLGPREAVLSELRARHIDAAHPALLQPLERFEPTPDTTQVVVFLHGLFSTDVGLFDPLVTRLGKMPNMAHTAYVGFAHNPLTGIGETAGHVAAELASRIGPQGKDVPVVLVGHHRGGLVARAAAVKLYAGKTQAYWIKHLLGCVSLGTPHRGVSGADSESRTLGAIALVAAPDAFGNPPRGFMCLSDLLRLRSAMAGEPLGLDDLLPPAASYAHAGKRRFLDRLQDDEAQARRIEPSQRMPLHAVGGDAPTPMPWRWVRKSHGAIEGDDWLVALSSSAPSDPSLATSHRECEADHRSYFLEQTTLDDAAQRISGWFATHGSALEAAQADAARLRRLRLHRAVTKAAKTPKWPPR